MPERPRLDLSLGYVMAAGMLMCTFGGYWIGIKTGHRITGLMTGITLGITFCGYEAWKEYRKSQR